MRLDVFCQDRIGLARELLDLLVMRGIDLRGIEIVPVDHVYLNFSAIPFEQLSLLMADIRRIRGVINVNIVSWLPSEREHRVLSALLVAMPEPVLFIDIKNKTQLANPAAQSLFNMDEQKLRNHNLSILTSDFNLARWLKSEQAEPQIQHVVIKGRDFLLEVQPVYAAEENEESGGLLGAMVMLKSTARMGQQLQKLAVNDDSEFRHIVTVSTKMRQVVEQARKLAMLDAPLLITGETGTGKDMLARACHLRSARGKKPFLALNCASLPDDVAESELFGHAPGAWPGMTEGKKGFFEQASGGSVLLDEIGEMSPQMQVKLLRFLNDGTFRRVGEDHEVHVDVRVICATQKNLAALVQRGEFREDLFYRLNVLTLNLPPLRERPQDIMPLAEMFIAHFADEQGVVCPRLSPQLSAFLSCYNWPGNVRQLKNTLYRALTQLEGYELRPEDIALPEQLTSLSLDDEVMEGSLDEIISRFERIVLQRLYLSYPSTRKLAKRLDISHTAIANKLREYNLSRKKQREED